VAAGDLLLELAAGGHPETDIGHAE
jgi:hypothetical protein